MSIFRQTIELSSTEGSNFESIEALVDTGATYTYIPREILERLQIAPQEQRQFILANGQEASYDMARVRLEGRVQPTPVIFGYPGSDALLGAVTLEEFGLGVDPLNQRLLPTPGYLVGIRDISSES